MFDVPEWWHHQGFKIAVIGMDHANSPSEKVLRLESRVVKINIRPACSPNEWFLEYEIVHFFNDTWSKGRFYMTTTDLEEAFWLKDTCTESFAQGIIDRFGGDVAYQGKFIRYRSYLNFPGPGTGLDGDPNVSVRVDDDIKGWVRKFLGVTE